MSNVTRKHLLNSMPKRASMPILKDVVLDAVKEAPYTSADGQCYKKEVKTTTQGSLKKVCRVALNRYAQIEAKCRIQDNVSPSERTPAAAACVATLGITRMYLKHAFLEMGVVTEKELDEIHDKIKNLDDDSLEEIAYYPSRAKRILN